MQIFTLIPCVGGELELSTDCSDGCGEGGKVHNDPLQLPGLSLVTNFFLPYSCPRYTYNDATCDYRCMATEYVYWGMSAYVGR